MDFQTRVLSSLVFGLSNLPKAGFKLLIRRDNFVPVGIITAKRTILDSSTMMPRTWAEGVRIEEDALARKKWFKEPLDRFDQSRQAFEPVVLCENQYGIVITARRTSSAKDDEDNFMWLENPMRIQEFRKIQTDLGLKDRVISSLRNDLEAVKKERDFWKDAAETSGAESRDLRERISVLQRKVYLLQAQADYYKLEAMVKEGLNVEVEAAFRQILRTARERGIDFVATDADRTLKAIENLKRQREKIAALVPASGVGEEELRKLRREISEMRQMLAGKGREAPSPPPPKPQEEIR